MADSKDPYYGALLVERARLHLGTVMAGQDSEPFFLAMLKIAESNIHLGYTTLNNKQVKLKGIKDFLHSVYYGLGIKNMNEFVLCATKSAIREKSKNRYAYKFIDWLKDQDPIFCFPQEFFEFRRVMRIIAINKNRSKYQKHYDFKTARFLYEMAPHLMQDIGPDRKYKTVETCYFEEGYAEKRKLLTPIRLYQNPTSEQVEEIAVSLFERFGKARSRLLALKLLDQCANARSSWAGDAERVDDDAAAWPEWVD